MIEFVIIFGILIFIMWIMGQAFHSDMVNLKKNDPSYFYAMCKKYGWNPKDYDK